MLLVSLVFINGISRLHLGKKIKISTETAYRFVCKTKQ
ncbi:hypothetical protein MNB_SUP05-SYMBIONT-4-670 [hydrothermal vent metagenome]|uniref:Uncharacterized protein n=1 Tax=hydrothermal vent metagenome TaxID=652676 RepID=A0A1W1DYX5_9ZZZZ